MSVTESSTVLMAGMRISVNVRQYCKCWWRLHLGSKLCFISTFQPGPLSCVVPGCSSAGTGDVSVRTRSVMGNMIVDLKMLQMKQAAPHNLISKSGFVATYQKLWHFSTF